MADTQHRHTYVDVLESFTPEEFSKIVQLKRLFEWAQGDAEFRKRFESNTVSPADQERLNKIGVHIDLQDVAVLWEKPDLVATFLVNNRCVCVEDLPQDALEGLKDYPLFQLWLRYVSRYNTKFREARKRVFRVPQHPRFNEWRLRRISSVRNELGYFGHYVDHPILAFELGDGCSVGCWFCAFSSRKLTKNFDYHQNRDLFVGIAKECVDLFGNAQAAAALLYYGTEPHDNPNYLDCVKDYAEITGYSVCTSTAVPGDAPWMRELIAYYRRGNHPWPRLSVLTKKALHTIHDLYTPEELRDVELLMQMKEAPRDKVKGGRIMEGTEGLRGVESSEVLDATVPQGSIACVTGFLTNLVNQTIQLISPCYTSKEWPLGYRIFDQDTFDGVSGFRQTIDRMIARNMKESPQDLKRVRYRDDIRYRKNANGFDLVSPNQVHTFTGEEIYEPLGSLIAEGTYTHDTLIETLMDRHRRDPITAAIVVKSLFDNGFLDEVDAR